MYSDDIDLSLTVILLSNNFYFADTKWFILRRKHGEDGVYMVISRCNAFFLQKTFYSFLGFSHFSHEFRYFLFWLKGTGKSRNVKKGKSYLFRRIRFNKIIIYTDHYKKKVVFMIWKKKNGNFNINDVGGEIIKAHITFRWYPFYGIIKKKV
jgi:hypothetical protein